MSDKKETESAAVIIGIADGILTLLSHLNALRVQAKERGELTPEQEAELDAKLEAMFKSEAWKLSGR